MHDGHAASPAAQQAEAPAQSVARRAASGQITVQYMRQHYTEHIAVRCADSVYVSSAPEQSYQRPPEPELFQDLLNACATPCGAAGRSRHAGARGGRGVLLNVAQFSNV